MTTENAEGTIEALRDWLETHRARYSSGTSVLQDPIQVKGFIKGLMARVGNCMGYNPLQHGSDVAVFEIGKLQERMVSVFEDIEFLDEFEEKRQRYLEAIKGAVKPSEPADRESDNQE